jgi:hypothetical protein
MGTVYALDMATPKEPAPSPEPAFSDTQRGELEAMIAKAVGGGTPLSAPVNEPKGPKPVTDDDWDRMPDRQRESWVRQLVDFRLDELMKMDADAERDRKLAELEAATKVVPEKPPSVVSRIQSFLWGTESE